jgi:hypothetical protein
MSRGGAGQQVPHRAFSPIRNDKGFFNGLIAKVTNVHLSSILEITFFRKMAASGSRRR